MNIKDIQALIKLNREFYDSVEESFSGTRKNPWPGWSRILEHISAHSSCSLNVLDLACGNGRFERFLITELPEARLDYIGMDSCVPLMQSRFDQATQGAFGSMRPGENEGALSLRLRSSGLREQPGMHDQSNLADIPSTPQARYIACDILSSLMQGEGFDIAQDRFDLIVCFGFMHHVPTERLRASLLRVASSSLAPDGILAASFWRFADIPDLAEKAKESTSRGLEHLDVELEENDYLIGWNGSQDSLRYCHSFTDEEIDALIDSLGEELRLIDRYESDGRNNALNTYLVFVKGEESRL